MMFHSRLGRSINLYGIWLVVSYVTSMVCLCASHMFTFKIRLLFRLAVVTAQKKTLCWLWT